MNDKILLPEVLWRPKVARWFAVTKWKEKFDDLEQIQNENAELYSRIVTLREKLNTLGAARESKVQMLARKISGLHDMERRSRSACGVAHINAGWPRGYSVCGQPSVPDPRLWGYGSASTALSWWQAAGGS